MAAPNNVVSSEWAKWVAGLLLGVNSLCVGYVIRMETRVATLETSFTDQQRVSIQQQADAKEIRADLYSRLSATDRTQLEILQAIGLVREDVAAIRGAVGASRH
ncbi:hypothetical protein [Hymenobacter nivis]|uniref:Uncharacterized protein n=1 Tax=Hymenobacter nivis TaxID=1850093 RepID=A0A2Z3GKB2_9BACT|nr:hypothetical protein [Hymenobacter nivis]AWM31355.1 hypothetical protein DDQ68_00270 [Hymenobacter nivis]